jgi:(+)-pinoresinol hydroxylase
MREMKMRLLAFAAGATALLCGFVAVGIASAQESPDEERGQAVFNHWCAPCHAPGPGHPGTQGLEMKYRDGSIPAVLEERDDLTPELVKVFVRQGVLSMAPFRKTEVTDAELEDLAAYLSK